MTTLQQMIDVACVVETTLRDAGWFDESGELINDMLGTSGVEATRKYTKKIDTSIEFINEKLGTNYQANTFQQFTEMNGMLNIFRV